MTNREFFNAVIAANLSDEMTAKATALLATVEKKSASRSAKQTENRNTNEGIAANIAALMTEGVTYAASEIVKLTENAYSTAKVTAVMKIAAEIGLVTVVDGYKVGGKGRAVKGYTLATAENEGEGE